MGRKRKKRIKRSHPPGTLPGTLVAHAEADAVPVQIFMFSYDPDRCEERALRPQEIPSLAVPENGVLWLDIWGLSDPGVVKAVGDRFGFHPLALEDVLNVPQRPKVDRYENHLLIVLKEVRYPEEPEQVSLFLSDRVVVTFQERAGDPFDPIRDRLRKGLGRLRTAGADYLAYSLCDGIVDSFFPTLEKLGDEVEELEEREMASSLVDEYMSSVSNRMNEIMKVLTIVATIFIPLTFIAGLYGMNFDREASPLNMRELGWRYGYPFVLLVMAITVAGMLYHFRKRKWL